MHKLLIVTSLLAVCTGAGLSAPTTASAPASAPAACKWSVVAREYPRMTYYMPNHWPPDEPPQPEGSPPTRVNNVVLENEYIAIEVAVEAAGRVMHATYKHDKTELFNVLEKLAGGKVWDGGGWRPSFPANEHGMRYTDQPASWRVIEGEDGSVTLAMDMRFGRFTDRDGLGRYGRFTHLRLGRTITLRPGQATFESRMVVENPLPYRYGYRLWSTAQFPHERDAVFLLPVSRVSDHRGAKMADWSGGQGLAIHSNWDTYHSVFSVNPVYPFAGVYYPSRDANHLRISDPAVAPGAKLWAWSHPSAFYELWTGMDRVFEQPGRLLEPFATGGYTETYWVARGIGPVEYANENFAVSLKYERKDKLTTAVVSYTPSREFTDLKCFMSGYTSGGGWGLGKMVPSLKPGAVATNAPVVTGSGSPVSLTITDASKKVLLHCVLPLEMPLRDDEDEKALVASMSPPATDGKARAIFGETRDWMDWYLGRRDNGSLRDGGVRGARKWVEQSSHDPQAYLELGRLLARAGKLDEAAARLAEAIARATPPASAPATAPATQPAGAAALIAQAHHLLGLVLVEQGKHDEAQEHFRTAAAEAPEARYMLALAAIAAGDRAGACAQLEGLLAKRPDAYRPALLLAALAATGGHDKAATDKLLSRLHAADPSSVELAYVLTLVNPDDKGLAKALAAMIKQDPEMAGALGAFEAELNRGVWVQPRRP
jgi:tetratricopeptide (TPR) repeat protein